MSGGAHAVGVRRPLYRDVSRPHDCPAVTVFGRQPVARNQGIRMNPRIAPKGPSKVNTLEVPATSPASLIPTGSMLSQRASSKTVNRPLPSSTNPLDVNGLLPAPLKLPVTAPRLLMLVGLVSLDSGTSKTVNVLSGRRTKPLRLFVVASTKFPATSPASLIQLA